MAKAPGKIHTVTRHYLAGWALSEDGLLRPVDVRHGVQKPKVAAGVGWARDWWGDDNPALNEACETACAKLEGLVPKLLRGVEQRWPFHDKSTRAVLAQFIALHVVRTDATREVLATARENSLRGLRATWDIDMPFNRFAARMRSDGERARKLLAMLGKVASVLGSMHWTLVQFDEPIIITGDHPVCLVPLLGDDEVAPVAGAPVDGLANIVEFRFPLAPSLVLLGSWHPGDEMVGPVRGDWNDAANVNGVVRAQARRQYFRAYPGPMPAFPPMIFEEPDLAFEPMTPRFIPGYGAAAARTSPLRDGVIAKLEALIESQQDETLFIARPQHRSSGA